jgi:hypothetical protein
MKPSRYQFIAFGVVFWMIASACAAPALPPPTATQAPPTLAPTLAPTVPAPTATAAPPTQTPTAAPSPAPTTDALAVIKMFQDAYNKRDTEALLSLLVDDPNWALVLGSYGQFLWAGSPKSLQNVLAFEFELNTHIEASDCTMTSDQATCLLVVTDDCQPSTLDAYRVTTHFGFEAGKIALAFARAEQAEQNAFDAYDSERAAWARDNLPDESAALNNPDEWFKFGGTGDLGLGKLSASAFGQAADRICKGYTAAGH